jgi:DNA-binding transcriptional ArsR family regulator
MPTHTNNTSIEVEAEASRNHFISKNDSTHAKTVSSSMGVVLVRLSKKYLVPQDLQPGQDIEALKLERQANAITAFETFISEKGLLVAGSDLEQAISYVKGLGIDQWDTVTYWEKSDKDELERKDVVISVKETLAIVCAALMDETVYQYESEAERDKAKTERLKVLCACLINLSKHRACHTDARHEIARLLNHNYPDVSFITIDYDFILQHIQQEIEKKLFLKDGAWKTNFKTIVWPWIREGEMPEEAWARLNITTSTTSSSSSSSSQSESASSPLFTEQLKTSLEAAFLSHGLILKDKTTDNKKTIGEAINSCCIDGRIKELDYPPVKDPLIIKLYSFMKSLGEKEKAKKEIKAFIQWLDSDLDPHNKDHIAKLNKYFEVYEMTKKITRYGYVLRSEGHGELLAELKAMIESYFTEGLEVSGALQEKIEAFNGAYSKFHTDKKPAWIESFFGLWFASEDAYSQERAHLFYRLCHPEYQRIIRISDQEIEDIYNDYQQRSSSSNDESTVIEIDVYFLNRCLLHALTVPVAEWSDIFNRTLIQLHQFILNDFNDHPLRGVAGQLKKDSYPTELLTQIKYLLDCYALKPNKPETRPGPAVLTPTVMDAHNQVLWGICYVGMASSNEDDINRVTTTVNVLADKTLGFSAEDLAFFLPKFSTANHRVQVIVAIKDKIFQLSGKKLTEIFSQLATVEQRLQVFEALKNKVSQIFGEELDEIFGFEIEEHRLHVFNALKDKVFQVISVTLVNILSKFATAKQRLQILGGLKDKVPHVNDKRLVEILCQFATIEERLQAWNMLKDKVIQVSGKGLANVLSQFATNDHRVQVFNALKDKISQVTDEELTNVFSQFVTDEQRMQVLNALKGKVSQVTGEAFAKALSQFTTNDHRAEVFNTLKRKVFEVTGEALANILSQLGTTEQRLQALNLLKKNKVSQVSGEALANVLSKFETPEQRLQVLDALKDKVSQLSVSELITILSKFAPAERVVSMLSVGQPRDHRFPVFNMLKDKISQLSASELIAVLSIFVSADRGVRVVSRLSTFKFPDSDHCLQVFNAFKDKVSQVTGEELANILSHFVTDEQCLQVFNALKDKVLVFSGDALACVLSQFRTDAHHREVLGELKVKVPQFFGNELARVLSKFSTDTHRREVLDELKVKVPQLFGEDLAAILSTFISDGNRLEVLKVLKDKVAELDGRSLATILFRFEDDDARLQALNLLKEKVLFINDEPLDEILGRFKGFFKRRQASSVLSSRVLKLASMPTDIQRQEVLYASTNEMRRIFSIDIKTVLSKFKDPEIRIKVLKQFLLKREIACSETEWKRKAQKIAHITGIALLQNLCMQYIARCKSYSAFFPSTVMDNEAQKIIELIEKVPNITLEDIAEYLSRVLIFSKKAIYRDSDLLVIFEVVKQSMQNKNVNTLAASASSSSSSSSTTQNGEKPANIATITLPPGEREGGNENAVDDDDYNFGHFF